MITYCDRCNDTETLEDGFTCKKCGYKPIPMYGTINNLYSGMDEQIITKEKFNILRFVSRLFGF